MGCIFSMKVVRPCWFLFLFLLIFSLWAVFATKSNVSRVVLSSCTDSDFDGLYVLLVLMDSYEL